MPRRRSVRRSDRQAARDIPWGRPRGRSSPRRLLVRGSAAVCQSRRRSGPFAGVRGRLGGRRAGGGLGRCPVALGPVVELLGQPTADWAGTGPFGLVLDELVKGGPAAGGQGVDVLAVGPAARRQRL